MGGATHTLPAPPLRAPAFVPKGTRQLRLLALVAAALFAACARGEETGTEASRQSPIIPLDTGTVFIETETDTFQVSVEIAETPNQREIGLMEREELPQDEGMIFLSYEEQDSTEGFWMFRTRIPLDIAYLDRDGRIVSIRTMQPCTSPVANYCDPYPPGARYWGALEVNGGYFAERGIGTGDRVLLRRGQRMLTPGDSA
jgi:uncharacterized protein